MQVRRLSNNIRPWRIFRHLVRGYTPFGRRYCVACDHSVQSFLPYRRGIRDVPPLLRELDSVGSDVEHFECPRCGAHDRERHVILYLQQSGLLQCGYAAHVLHFAPERHLSRLLNAAAGEAYIACDLHPANADVRRVDLCAMPFETASVGLLLANHVLEHVFTLQRALSEIHRVLERGGSAVLQTPYSRALTRTWEDPGICTPNQRLQAYGQEDHVRLFSADIFSRIEDAGLKFVGGTHEELLPACDPDRYGINGNEPFMLFRKC